MDTNKPDLPELIERYESGNTSLEDDQILFDYFNDRLPGDAPESLRAQLIYFKSKKNEKPSAIFETQLQQILERAISRRSNVRFLLRVAALLVIGSVIGWLALSPANHFKETASTGPKERSRIVLSDGTIVFLNSNSELTYDGEFGDQTRAVHLKGEAYFEVQRDIARPFIIHTGDAVTEVLGTSFNVRHYEDEKVTEINVKSGQVRFGSGQKAIVMKGERATKSVHGGQIEVTEANANADAWKTRKLTFKNAKMVDVIRDVERYFRCRIEVATLSLLDCHFTGEFSNPSSQDVLEVMSYSLSIQYTVENDRYILSGQRCQ